MDENSVDVLGGAVIQYNNREETVYTDEKGRFELRSLCAGEQQFYIQHIGCEPQLISLFLSRDTTIRIRLNHKEELLHEVEIVQHRKEAHVTQQAITLQNASLENNRGLTLGATLEKITGVTTLYTGYNIAKPVIHGLHSNRVLIVNNGVRQESQQWGTEHAPEVDPFLAKRITVVKGAGSLRYGSDAIGGVILVDADALPDNAAISGEVNTVFHTNNREVVGNATIQGNHAKINAFSWRVQGTYRRGGNNRTPSYWLKNTGVEEGNFSIALGWKKPSWQIETFYSRFYTRIAILSVAHVHNLTDLQSAIEAAQPRETSEFSYRIDRPYQFVIHDLAKVRASFNTGKAGKLDMLFSVQFNNRLEYDKHKPFGDNDNRPAFQFKIQTLAFETRWEHTPVRGFSGSVGVQGATQTNNFRYGYFIPAFWNFSAGVFAIERFTYKRLELEAGLRIDYRWMQAYLRNNKPVHQWVVPSGSIGFDYHFNNYVKWNVNIANAWRAPQVVELYADGVHHGAASFEKGSAALNPEIAFDMSTSVEFVWKWLRVGIGGYQYFINDFIYARPAQPATLTIRGAYPTFLYTQANVSFTGTDIDIAIHPFKGVEVFQKTSLLRAWNRTDNDWLFGMPPQQFEYGLRYSTNLKDVCTDLFAQVSVQHVLKQFNAPGNMDYSPPPNGYYLLNAEVGGTFHIKSQPIKLNARLQNITNVKYRNYLNRFRYFADERGFNASIHLQIPFLINIKTQ